MSKNAENDDLLRRAQARGKVLAILRASDDVPIALEPGVDAVPGLWDGMPALALVSTRDLSRIRDGYEEDLKSLHDLSIELSQAADPMDICKQAVLSGHERLGIDRLGIWLIDQEDPRWKGGTWGIDERGRLRDERGQRQQLETGDVPVEFYEGKIPYLSRRDVPCRDAKGKVVGRADKLIAPLWDGRRFIGEFSVDNLLGREPISAEKTEAIVIYARIVAHLVSLKRAEAELRLLASVDALTGAVNRRTALIILEKHIGQSRRNHGPLTLCVADLDGLKLVNDAFGHAAGDDYIKRVSSALVGAVRASDTVGRIGGDEFLVVFPDCKPEAARTIMEKVNRDLAKAGKALAYVPRLSWGISSLGELTEAEGLDAQRRIDVLLELADKRMYEDKRAKGAARPRSDEAELAF
jgi:diguanylate cyclase (GGDEF)-like protein